ncbi:hypothetical protein MXB_4689, partial [Myxobolus squamalis]
YFKSKLTGNETLHQIFESWFFMISTIVGLIGNLLNLLVVNRYSHNNLVITTLATLLAGFIYIIIIANFGFSGFIKSFFISLHTYNDNWTLYRCWVPRFHLLYFFERWTNPITKLDGEKVDTDKTATLYFSITIGMLVLSIIFYFLLILTVLTINIIFSLNTREIN